MLILVLILVFVVLGLGVYKLSQRENYQSSIRPVKTMPVEVEPTDSPVSVWV